MGADNRQNKTNGLLKTGQGANVASQTQPQAVRPGTASSTAQQPSNPSQKTISIKEDIVPPKQAVQNNSNNLKSSKFIVTTPPPNSSKKSIILIFLVIVVLVSVAGGGYYFYSQKVLKDSNKIVYDESSNNLPLSVATQKLIPTPTLLANPTKGWQTYLDQENGFLIKYPPEYILSDYSEGVFSGILIKNASASQAALESEIVDGTIIKALVVNEAVADLEDYVLEKKAAEEPVAKDSKRFFVSDISTLVVGGKAAYEYVVEEAGTMRVIFVGLGNSILKITIYYIGDDKAVGSYESIAKEIINLLQFVDREEVVGDEPGLSTVSSELAN